MPRLIAMLAALVALASLGAASAAAKPKVTLIGDSVADSMEHNPVALASLNDGFRLNLQTRGCRRLVAPSCTIAGSSGPAPTALQVVKRFGSLLGKVVVVDVGYNDTPTRYGQHLDTLMRALQDSGVKTVVWLTLRDPKHVYQASNDDIRREPKEWPALVIADWDGYSDLHPDWFEADGIHPTALGAAKLGQFIHSVLVRYANRAQS